MKCPACGHEMDRINDRWECGYCGITAPAIPKDGKTERGKGKTIIKSDVGKIDPIERFKQLPGRVAETMMEGLATKPVEFTIIGLGFYLGYEGIDIMKYLTGLLKPFVSQIPGFGSEAQMREMVADAWKLPIYGPVGLILEQVFFPPEEKETEEDPFKDLPAGRAAVDDIPDKYPWAKEYAEFKARVLLGCIGAISAYAITRPGFISETVKGVGEIIKGIGEITPL